jgi:hypothetical protein
VITPQQGAIYLSLSLTQQTTEGRLCPYTKASKAAIMPLKLKFKTVQGKQFDLEFDEDTKVRTGRCHVGVGPPTRARAVDPPAASVWPQPALCALAVPCAAG